MVQTRPPIEVSSRAQIAFKPTKGFVTPAVSPPYLRGANILYDPGFEGFVDSTYGMAEIINGVYNRETYTGSHTYPVPRYDTSCALGRWPNGTCSDRFSPWLQRNGSYVVDDVVTDTAWVISNADPRSGQWGAVWWDWQASEAFSHPALLMVQGFNHPAGMSARALSGDTVTFGAWIRVTDTSNTPQVAIWLTFYTSSLSTITSSTSTLNLSTTYTYESFTTGCPSNTYYVRAMMDWQSTGSFFTTTMVDDAVLGIQ